MIVGDITAISVVTVLDRGVPNKEAIAIRVLESVDSGCYGLMIGFWNQQIQRAQPLHDHLFWFGDVLVKTGDWIFIYTGAGKPSSGKTVDEMNNTYSIYWNKKQTIFANSNIVPVLFRVDAVDILMPKVDLPQLSSLP